MTTLSSLELNESKLNHRIQTYKKLVKLIVLGLKEICPLFNPGVIVEYRNPDSVFGNSVSNESLRSSKQNNKSINKQNTNPDNEQKLNRNKEQKEEQNDNLILKQNEKLNEELNLKQNEVSNDEPDDNQKEKNKEVNYNQKKKNKEPNDNQKKQTHKYNCKQNLKQNNKQEQDQKLKLNKVKVCNTKKMVKPAANKSNMINKNRNTQFEELIAIPNTYLKKTNNIHEVTPKSSIQQSYNTVRNNNFAQTGNLVMIPYNYYYPSLIQTEQNFDFPNNYYNQTYNDYSSYSTHKRNKNFSSKVIRRFKPLFRNVLRYSNYSNYSNSFCYPNNQMQNIQSYYNEEKAFKRSKSIGRTTVFQYYFGKKKIIENYGESKSIERIVNNELERNDTYYY